MARGRSPAAAAPRAPAAAAPEPAAAAAAAPPPLLALALTIIVCNLGWGYTQERVGATAYCDAAGGACERFTSVGPLLQLAQALCAAAVAFACIAWRGARHARVGGALDLLPSALCHTVASPVGYLAMQYMCVVAARRPHARRDTQP